MSPNTNTTSILGEPEEAPLSVERKTNELPVSRRSKKGFTLDEPTILDGKVTTLRDLDDAGRLKVESSTVWEGKPLFRFRHRLYEAVLNNGKRSWVITPEAYETLFSNMTIIDEVVEWPEE